ncbi:unnamed protein product [Victoria cruziana]
MAKATPGMEHDPAVYADSVDSSPRSEPYRWDDAPPAAGGKLRLMCSYGGRIVPRPHDKSLCYVGGETRIVLVDRHSSLADLSSRLSRHLLAGKSFSLKYQLPNEDLDSLISVTTDDDLENMIDEYDRCQSSPRPSRLRLFLFPAKPDSASSLGSLLEDSKAESWFVDALNGAAGLPRNFSDSATSVDCLLGLDTGSGHPADWDRQDSVNGEGSVTGKTAKPEVQSVPDSPKLETSSSFGSASSAPSVSNLPPIRVRTEDPMVGGISPGLASVEEQFGQIGLGQDAVKPPPEPEVPARDNPPPPPKPVYYQDQGRFPAASPSNHPVVAETKRELPDQNYRVQIQYPADHGFLVPQALPPEYHYLHHQASAAAAAVPPPPMPSFYQIHHHHPQHQQQPQQQQVDQQIPMYFLHPQASAMAMRQNQAFNFAAYQSAMADPANKPMVAPVAPPGKDSPVLSYAAGAPPPSSSRASPRPELAGNLYRTAASPAAVPLASSPFIHAPDQQQYAGYRHPLHPAAHLAYDYGEPSSHAQQLFYAQHGMEASTQLPSDAKQARS